MQVLELFGFGPVNKWIGFLYKAPMAYIKLNGKMSSLFPGKKGNEVRVPTPPALFALVIDPLVEALCRSWMSWDSCGFHCRKTSTLCPSLSAALQILDLFAGLSGLHAIWDKSLILLIDPGAMTLVDPNSPLQWTNTK